MKSGMRKAESGNFFGRGLAGSYAAGRAHIRALNDASRAAQANKKISGRAPAVRPADNQPVHDGAGLKNLTTGKN